MPRLAKPILFLVVLATAPQLMAQADIELQCPRGTAIPNGGLVTTPDVYAATPTSLECVLANETFSGLINLTGSQLVAISNEINCSAVVTQQPFTPFGGESPFYIDITPAAVGAFSFDITIENDDPDENPYVVHFSGTAIAVGVPDIELTFEYPYSAPAPDGSTIVLYGGVANFVIDPFFYIHNSGTAQLNISGPPLALISNETNCSAIVTVTPFNWPDPVAAGGGTRMLTLDVTPAAAGPYGFDIQILSNDPDEGVYTVHVVGDATAIFTREINLLRPSTISIPDGGTDTVTGASAGNQTSLTYTIRSEGAANLNLNGSPLVAISGQNNCAAVVSTDPSSTVNGMGGETTFVVDVTPTVAGAFSFQFSIDNNDSNEDPYNVTVNGNAAALPGPEIDVQRGVPIADGGSDTVVGAAVGSTTTLTYTIENQGPVTLILNTPVTTSNTVNCSAVVTQQPNGLVMSGGGTTTLTIEVTPASAGAFSFDLSIGSDDPDENPYDIAASGNAAAGPAPEIDLQRPAATSIAHNGTDDAGSRQVGQAFALTYTIRNSGQIDLNLLGATPATVGSPANCVAAVILQPSTPVASAGGTTTFTVQITPSAAGAFSVNLLVASDDSDENPYVISITGSGTTAGSQGGGTTSGSASGSGGGGGGCTAHSDGRSVFWLFGLAALVAAATWIRAGMRRRA